MTERTWPEGEGRRMEIVENMIPNIEFDDIVRARIHSAWQEHGYTPSALAYNAFFWQKHVDRANQRGTNPQAMELLYDDPEVAETPYDGTPLAESIKIGYQQFENYVNFVSVFMNAFNDFDISRLKKHNGLVIIANHDGYHALGKLAHGIAAGLHAIGASGSSPQEDIYTIVGPSVLTKSQIGHHSLGDGLLAASNRIKTFPLTTTANEFAQFDLANGIRMRAARRIIAAKKTPGKIVIVSPTGTNDHEGRPGPAATGEGILTSIKMSKPGPKTAVMGVSLAGGDHSTLLGAAIGRPYQLDQRMSPQQVAKYVYDSVYGELYQEAKDMVEAGY